MHTQTLKRFLVVSVITVFGALFFQNCAKPFSAENITNLSSDGENDSYHLDEIATQQTDGGKSSRSVVYMQPNEITIAAGSDMEMEEELLVAAVSDSDIDNRDPYVGFGGSKLNITGINPIEGRYSGDFRLTVRRIEDASTPALTGDMVIDVTLSYRQANGTRREVIPVRIANGTHENILLIKALPKDIICDKGVASLSFSIERTANGVVLNPNMNGIPASVLRPSPFTYQLGCPPPPDIAAPKSLRAVSVTGSSVQLKWDLVNGARGYYIVRGREVIAEVSKEQAANGYIDSGLAAGAEYYYRVYAMSDATVSLPASYTVSTKNQGIKLVQFEVNPTSVASGQSARVYCKLENASKLVVYQGSKQLYSGSQNEIQLTSNVVKVSDGESKNFRCDGYESLASQKPEFTKTISVNVTNNDTQAPSAPTGVRIQQTSKSSFNVYWEPSQDNFKVSKYKLYWQTPLNYVGEAGDVNNTMEPVTGLPVERRQNQEFWLSAVDEAGNESSKTYFKVSLPQ